MKISTNFIGDATDNGQHYSWYDGQQTQENKYKTDKKWRHN